MVFVSVVLRWAVACVLLTLPTANPFVLPFAGRRYPGPEAADMEAVAAL
jgi:hypothetical protein